MKRHFSQITMTLKLMHLKSPQILISNLFFSNSYIVIYVEGCMFCEIFHILAVFHQIINNQLLCKNIIRSLFTNKHTIKTFRVAFLQICRILPCFARQPLLNSSPWGWGRGLKPWEGGGRALTLGGPILTPFLK